MIEINKCKLVPGITSNWGDILGDITKQQDLVDYVASHGGGGGGDATWGNIQGTLSDQTDLNNRLTDIDNLALEALNDAKDVDSALGDHIAANDAAFAEAFSRISALEQNPGVSQQAFDVHAAQNTAQFQAIDAMFQNYATNQRVNQLYQANFDLINQVQSDLYDFEGSAIVTEQCQDPGLTDYLTSNLMISPTLYTYDEQVTGDNEENRCITAWGNYYDTKDNSRLKFGKITTNYELNQDTQEYELTSQVFDEGATKGYVDDVVNQNCMLNKSELKAGSKFIPVTNYVFDYTYENFWTTPSGRLFHTEADGTTTYEFMGSGFNEVVLAGTPMFGSYKKYATTDGKLYCYNGSSLYQWFENYNAWYEEEHGLDTPSNELWSAGETLRCGSEYIWRHAEWQSDPIQDYKGDYSIVCNGNVYVSDDHYTVYQYDESTKTYTELGSCDAYINNWFVFQDEIYFPDGGNVVRKIDLSKVGSGEHLDVTTNIICSSWDQFYGTCKYSDYLYTVNPLTQEFGRCYDIEYNTPEIPGVGDYFLTVSKDDYERVTYSWETKPELDGMMKLVEKEGIEIPVVDRPNASIDPDSYSSTSYILSMNEIYNTINDIRQKSVDYISCEGDMLIQKYRTYHEVNGEWVLQNEVENQPAWIGSGWDVLWKRDILSDPNLEVPENYPINVNYDVVPEESSFGYLDEETWEFNGFKMDDNYNLGKYKVEGVEQGSLIVYEETFIPYIAAEAPDTSTDATYVLKATVQDGEVTYEWVPEV